MKVKYVCPECGGKIKYWAEYFVYKTQSINPQTGALSKRISIGDLQEANCGDMCGIGCTSCGWILNMVNGDVNNDKFKTLIDWLDEHENEIKV